MRSLIVALALSLALPAAAAASQPNHQEHKLPICHRTASETNPWVIITPDKASWQAHLDLHVNHNPKNGRGDQFAIQWKDGSWHCQEEPVKPPPKSPPSEPPRTVTPPPPPPPNTGIIRASGYVCGDPRVVLRTRSTWDTKKPIKVRYVSAKTGKAKVVKRMTRPGFKRYDRFWVKGNTRFVVRDSTGIIWKTWVDRKANIGKCPR